MSVSLPTCHKGPSLDQLWAKVISQFRRERRLQQQENTSEQKFAVLQLQKDCTGMLLKPEVTQDTHGIVNTCIDTAPDTPCAVYKTQ